MKEKYNHINKNFTNLAWKEMEALLDKEMPVAATAQGRKRRWLFILLFFGLAIGVGSSLWALGYFDEAKEEAPKKLHFAKTEKFEQENTAESTKEIVSNEANRNEKKAIVKQAGTSNENEIIENKLTSISKDVEQKDEENFLIKTRKSEISTIMENSPENEKEVIENELVINELVAPENLDFIGISLFQSKNQDSELSIPFVGLEKIEPSNDDVQNQSIINLHAGSIAGNSTKNRALTGYNGGINLVKNLSNKKWAIETGLNYAYLKNDFIPNNPTTIFQDNSSNPSELENLPNGVRIIDYIEYDDEFVDATNISTFEILNDPNLSFEDPAISMHYLNLPVSLFWKANPKLDFYSGLGISALLVASDGVSTGGLFNNRNLDSDHTYKFNSSDYALVHVQPLKKFDFSAHLGMRYNFSKHFSADMRYHRGFRDFINGNFQRDINNGLQVSLYYNFYKNK